MKQEVLDKLFGAWTKRHNKLMGNQPRVCKCLPPNKTPSPCPSRRHFNLKWIPADYLFPVNTVVEALVTRNTWQKRGCATAILAEADKIADEIDVPLFLDGAVPEFYKRRGYSELLNDSGVEASAVPMLRKKKSERV